MHDRLQMAFSAVQAEDTLKAKTLDVIYHKARRRKKYPLVWAAACLLLLVGLGGVVFFTPVSAIGIDINPSLELKINRFDRVIQVEGRNEDGWELVRNTQLLYADYTEAIDTLLADAKMQSCLERGEVLSIVVVCDDEQRSSEMLAKVESCAGEGKNIHCHAASGQKSEDGHGHGARHRHQRHRHH